MAANRSKNPRKPRRRPAAKEEEPQESAPPQDFPVPPSPKAPDQSLDDALIDEWDPEASPTIRPENGPGEDSLPPDPADEDLDEPVHADEYRRISEAEIEEFESLLEDDGGKVEFSRGETAEPQLRLLPENEVDEFDSLFEEEEDLNPAGGDSPLPVAIIEDETMETESEAQEPNPTVYPVSLEIPPPQFEDRGMNAGFFIPEDELQPGIETPEEVEGAPPLDAPDGAPEMQDFAADLFFPPGPTMDLHPPPTPVGDLPPDSNLVEKEVTDDRVSRMMYRAEMARRRINDEIDSIELARELLELIRSATTLILSGKDKYEEAERSLNEVEFRLSYARRVKVWSDAIAYRLLSYEVFWLLFLGLGALFIPSILSAMIVQLNDLAPNSLPDFILADDLFLGVSTALWGGLGGVVGAMYALWRHVSLKQDFNPQHKMWYYTQPIMGIPIGVVIFLIVRIGIGYTVEGALDVASPYGIYMLAWIAGFQQNILYEIIRQILKIFRIQN